MRKILFALFVLAGPLSAPAQTISSITGPRMINSPWSPLWITSITMDQTDFLQSVTTANKSGKAIVSFQLGVIMAVPSTCGANETYAPEKKMQADRVSVKPGETAQTSDYRLLLSDIYKFGIANAATDVETQVTVIHVNFADGSEWTLPKYDKIYDRSALAADAKIRCAKPGATTVPNIQATAR